MSETDLGIVVVSWQTRALTLSCLEHAFRAVDALAPGRRAELRLVDNGSSDGTVEAARERWPGLDLVALPENRGYAAGCNAGMDGMRGRVLLLLNSDAEITASAIEAALDHFDREPRAGAVGVELRHEDGRPQNAIHAFPGPARELAPRWLLESLWPGRFPSKRRPPRAPVAVEAVLGAALFVRREVVDEIGGLDEGYFFFLEETDWCWRMGRAGWTVWFVPGAPVRHLSGASSKRRSAAATRIEFHRSLYRFVGLHRGRAARAAMMAVRVVRTLGTSFLLLFAAPFSEKERGRLAERTALLAWHVRGLPASGGLREVAREARSR